MDNRKKELRAKYDNRKIVGGIYRILNIQNGNFLLEKTRDLHAAQNLFFSCIRNDSCTHPRLRKAWDEFGKDAFTFEILETWEKDPLQTDVEYFQDLSDLYDSWNEKLPKDKKY